MMTASTQPGRRDGGSAATSIGATSIGATSIGAGSITLGGGPRT